MIYQENHSFDDTLGKLCVLELGCNGAKKGMLPSGRVIKLQREPDLVPKVAHDVKAQVTAINGGAMNGFGRIGGCRQTDGYACYAQFDPDQIPNLADLARNFTLSDATFESAIASSWPSHIFIASATLDGFQGNNPKHGQIPSHPGGGCDSGKDAPWFKGSKIIWVPSCIPDQGGNGPYRASPVKYVPTIMDRIEGAGLTWHMYNVFGPDNHKAGVGNSWTICPTFYECLGSSQKSQWFPADQFLTDAQNGNLPNLSFVVPVAENSQHNLYSMMMGDNWIGQVVSSVMNGPDWLTSAIFITYDECGCFYDHAVPPPHDPPLGIRIPLVIVSPYAKPRFTDSTLASTASILAFIEHTFGLAPLNSYDGTAYDFSNSFVFGKAPLAPIPLPQHRIPKWELRYLREHPPPIDVTEGPGG